VKNFIRKAAIFLMLTTGAAVGLGVGIYQNNHWYTKPPNPKPKPQSLFQQKTSHGLVFLNDKGDPRVGCTGTVIGPHAILTAEHCDQNMEFTDLNLDYSTRIYKVLTVTRDHRDHLILIVDGPAFRDIEPYVTAKAVVGEKEFFYGFGGDAYPAHETIGTVARSTDPSGIDAEDEIVYFHSDAVHGDSGAALYDSRGNILALLTYGGEDDDGKSQAIGFALAFTKTQIAVAQSQNPLAAIAALK
jgi:hypothetical protein